MSKAHTCFRPVFLATPAALASYIKHDFSVCVEKLLAACVHTAEGGKEQSNLGSNLSALLIHLYYEYCKKKQKIEYTQVTLSSASA